MDVLRVGTPSDRDNPIVDDWITKELDKLREMIKQPVLVHEGVTGFSDRFKKQYNHADNSPKFKAKLAERAGEVFAKLFAGGAGDPIVLRSAATVLQDMKDVNTEPALLAGVQSNNQAVRYLCAGSIIQLHDAIASDAKQATAALDAIGKAGAVEVNGVAMRRLYQAAGMENQVATAVPVMVEMMDARLAKMRANPRDLDRAEIAAVEYFAKADSGGKLDAPLRTEVVQRLAPLLRIHTTRFAESDLSDDERAAVMATIANVEDLLKRITKPTKAPDVSGVMQKGEGNDAALNMEIELLQWIGSKDTPGVLNSAPWNVPTGAP